MNAIVIAALSVLAQPEPASAAAAPAAEEVQVPLAQFRLRRFRVLGDDIVYLQGRRRQWYRAVLVEPCYALRGAMTIRFDTYGASTLDNASAIVAHGESCRIHSLTLSGPPPRRAR
jgi:hypothetical protein